MFLIYIYANCEMYYKLSSYFAYTLNNELIALHWLHTHYTPKEIQTVLLTLFVYISIRLKKKKKKKRILKAFTLINEQKAI